ncbi:hypothetical protein M513_10761 [Trichuris suis]|uniref:Uncharacterized protein n=1 Tax=Trichuris suis TaxID=68888 RepID=A0A085LTQ3_9BILA|nr:hypothetical protein M513_10761 [Trichuris suis]
MRITTAPSSETSAGHMCSWRVFGQIVSTGCPPWKSAGLAAESLSKRAAYGYPLAAHLIALVLHGALFDRAVKSPGEWVCCPD